MCPPTVLLADRAPAPAQEPRLRLQVTAADGRVAVAGQALSCRDRWRIWQAQRDGGHEPCFATPPRFLCADAQCVWREACLRLRAEWLR